MKKKSRKSAPAPRRRSSTRVRIAPKKTHATAAPAPGSIDVHAILVPIDFSVHSRNALKYAVPIAERFGATVRLVYVVEPTIYPADLGFGQVVLPGVEDELREKGSDELKAWITREIGGKVKASSVVRTGNPHQEILREAEESNIDLIVVATHGHTGVEHIIFGSTADRIVRHAKCPVLTVRPPVQHKDA